MLGAIIGDIAGSIYEGNPFKTKDFDFFGQRCQFTDNTVCTAAVADILLHDLSPAAFLHRSVFLTSTNHSASIFALTTLHMYSIIQLIWTITLTNKGVEAAQVRRSGSMAETCES